DGCRGESIATFVAATVLSVGRRSRRTAGGEAFVPAAAAPLPADAGLFERLRALRKQLADAEGVPAYIVFSDAVLRQMAARHPASRTELLDIPGVGPVKLDRYGAAFLEVLAGA